MTWELTATFPLRQIGTPDGFLRSGHSDPRITYRVYARFSPDHLRRAASALE